MNLHIRNAGEERESEPMITQHHHERLMKAEAHVKHLIVVQRDEFQKLAVSEGKDRIKLGLELDSLRSAYRLMIYLLGASMFGNIGMVAWQTL